jgi:hypothetical protein
MLDFVYHTMSADLAVAACELFWPSLIVYENRVFLADKFDSALFDQWALRLDHDLSRVEQVMNHRHLGDMFQSAQDISFPNRVWIGEVLKQTWRYKLLDQFPERTFHVEGQASKEDEDYLITFFQKTA